MNSRLKSYLVVRALIKLADKYFIPVSVLKKGDSDRGIILLKITSIDNKAVFFRSKFDYENKLSWQSAGKSESLDIIQSNDFIEKEEKIDADLWILEVEDVEKGNDVIKLFNLN